MLRSNYFGMQRSEDNIKRIISAELGLFHYKFGYIVGNYANLPPSPDRRLSH
jgi:hypothetical protein